MSEETRRDRRPLVAIFLAMIFAAILVIGAWLWAASQPIPVPTHDVNPPEVFWSIDPEIPGSEFRSAGPFLGLAYRISPDSFDPRADRLYAATPGRLYALRTEQDLGPGETRNAWGTLHYFNVSDPGKSRAISVPPLSMNYGDYVATAPDYELYLGTDDGRLHVLRDTGDAVPTGSDVAAHLDLDGAISGLAAYNGDMGGRSAITGTAVLTSFDGTRWVNQWLPETLEDLGEYASLALDGSERPYVAHYHATTGQPRVARPQNGSWYQLGQMEPYSATVNTGRYTSLAIGADDRPRVAYYDETETALKFARWDGSSWLTEFVDFAGDVGRHASLALDPVTDAPRIAYYNETGSLWYAAWSGSSWNLEQVSSGGVGKSASLALDASGAPRIAYLDEANGRLMLAAKSGIAWTTDSVAAVDSASAPVGLGDRGISLRIDALGTPHIAFRNATGSSLGYASKAGAQWSTTAVDDEGDVGLYPSLAVDGAGRPAIAYHDASSVDLKFARWTGTAWDVETVRSAGLVGLYTSLAFDAADRPHLASYEYNTSRTDADVVAAGTESGMLYGIDVSIPGTVAREFREKHVLSWRYRVRWAVDLGADVHLAGSLAPGPLGIPSRSLAFSPDGGLVFAGLQSAEVVAVETRGGTLAWRRTIPGTTWSGAPAASPSPDFDEDWILAAGDDGTASLYDDGGILRGTRHAVGGPSLTPAFAWDTAILASSTGEAVRLRLEDLVVVGTARLVGAPSGNVEWNDQMAMAYFGDDTGRIYAFHAGLDRLGYRAKLCDAVSAGPLSWSPPRSIQLHVWFGCRDGSVYAVSSRGSPPPVP